MLGDVPRCGTTGALRALRAGERNDAGLQDAGVKGAPLEGDDPVAGNYAIWAAVARGSEKRAGSPIPHGSLAARIELSTMGPKLGPKFINPVREGNRKSAATY